MHILCFIILFLYAGNVCYAQATTTGQSPELITFEDDFSSYKPGTFPAARWKNTDDDSVQNLLYVKREEKGNSLAISDRIHGQSAKPLFNTAHAEVVQISFSFLLETPESNVYIDHSETGHHTDKPCVCIISCANEHTLTLLNYGPGEAHANAKVMIPVDFATGIWHKLSINLRDGNVTYFVDNHKVFTQAGNYHFYHNFSTGLMLFARITNFKLKAIPKEESLSTLLTEGKVTTHAINFDVNAATIQPGSMPFINQLADMLQSTKIRLEIGGYTDSDGDSVTNLKLSQARADEVRNALIAQGVNAEKLTAKGYGAAKPLQPNTTPENKAMNRRVEFIKLP